MRRFLGIDFSGNHLMWRPGCSQSNVRISDVRRDGEHLVLERLLRVQELPGDDNPLKRLAALLREGNIEAAANEAAPSRNDGIPCTVDITTRRKGN